MAARGERIHRSLQLSEIIRGKDFRKDFDEYSNRYLKRLR
jgi:hypothetical protein